MKDIVNSKKFNSSWIYVGLGKCILTTHRGNKMALFLQHLRLAVLFFLRDAIIKVIRHSGKQVVSEAQRITRHHSEQGLKQQGCRSQR